MATTYRSSKEFSDKEAFAYVGIFCTGLTLMLLAVRLDGFYNIPWLYVLLPIYWPALLFVMLFIFYAGVGISKVLLKLLG